MTKVKNSMMDMESVAEDTNISDAISAGISDSLASEAEAEAGTDNEKLMTPLRTAQAIAAQVEPYTPTGYTPTVTGSSGGATWTTDLAHAVYYTTSDGKHRLTFNIRGHFDGNVSSANITITGAVFNATTNQIVTTANAAVAAAKGTAIAGQSCIACDFATADAVVFLSGDVLLNAAPTLP